MYFNWCPDLKFAVVLIFIAAISCTYHQQEQVPDCVVNAKNEISFKNEIQPILNAECNNAGCHQGLNAAGGLNLEPNQSFTELTNKRSGYLDTLNPEQSLLYSTLTSTTNPMPPAGPMDPCKINVILEWMRQGAKNN